MDRLRITTGARLHFGLLDTRSPFGGVGVMIDQPSTIVEFQPSTEDLLEELGLRGTMASDDTRETSQRIARVVKQFLKTTQRPGPVLAHLTILQRPAAHTGLGSGTQLSLAIAEGLCHITGTCIDSPVLTVEIAQRGQRSAVGAHGYWTGGLIYESAASSQKRGTKQLNPVVERCTLPEHWRVVLFTPHEPRTLVAGTTEKAKFSALPRPNSVERGGLKMIVEGQLIPAARAADFEQFAEAVFQYNLVSGRFFASAQNGAYNGPQTAAWIRRLRESGLAGVGQSSWGPTIFAFCKDQRHAEAAADLATGSAFQAAIVRPLNEGRRIETQMG